METLPMDLLSKIKSISPIETKAICVNLPRREITKFDALADAYNLNRSQLIALAMKTFREQVEAETAMKGLVAA
jgi:hypothetical protein